MIVLNEEKNVFQLVITLKIAMADVIQMQFWAWKMETIFRAIFKKVF